MDDNPDWILESLVAYLRGPVWNMPIQNFMEQKSVVFEENEDNDGEYQLIHGEFRNLVDIMLGAYMDDLDLQPEHLEQALGQIQPSIRSAALQELLEPVRAAGDFQLFKRLMQQKNEQLHRQALEILEQRQSHDPETDRLENGGEFSEMEIKEAIRQSLLAEELVQKSTLLEKRDMDRALAVSVSDSFIEKADHSHTPGRATETTETQSSDTTNAGKSNKPDPIEVEKRRALLRAQRDKLLSLKQQERQLQMRQLEKQSSEKPGNEVIRPKSGKAAREALSGESHPVIDENTLQYRRLLMQKIREEVEGSSAD